LYQSENSNLKFGKKLQLSLRNRMTTVKEALILLESHEKQCAIRYEHIEKRLEEGSVKFKRLEFILWGLYGLTAASLGVDKLL
jgi:hypothetical protein